MKKFSDTRQFVYLNDGVTKRKYVIAEIKLFPHKEISVIEIEREDKAISTLIYILNNHQYKTFTY